MRTGLFKNSLLYNVQLYIPFRCLETSEANDQLEGCLRMSDSDGAGFLTESAPTAPTSQP